MMAEKSQQTDKAITIDPHGDVKLILDGGTFKVSRTALCRHSSVFRVMLDKNSKFWEASDDAIGEDQLRNIHLREDDFDTMEIVMRVIYQHNDKVPKEVSFAQLEGIAVVCDKYELRECLVPWSLVWFQPYLDFIERLDFERWLFISIAFRNESTFTRITKHLIKTASLIPSSREPVSWQPGYLTTYNDVDIEEGVRSDIIRQIKEQRQTIIQNIDDLCRNLAFKLMDNHMYEVCQNTEEYWKCNRFNLGYLLQTYTRLFRPQAENHFHDPIETRIDSLLCGREYYGAELKFRQKREGPLKIGNKRFKVHDHQNCGLDKILYPDLQRMVDAVPGLVFKPIVDRKDRNSPSVASSAIPPLT